MNLEKKYSLSFISNIKWEEIFNKWKDAEEEVWRDYYTEKGFDSWGPWRQTLIEDLKPQDKEWKLYQITNPKNSISKMNVGPFKGWVKYYKDRDYSTFLDIAKNPNILNNEKITEISKNLPKDIFIFGMILKNEIILIEGTHRSAAIAVAAVRNEKIDSNIKIALTQLSEPEIKIVDQRYKKIMIPENRV